MTGEINVAAIMAAHRFKQQAEPPTTPQLKTPQALQRDQEREQEYREDWQRRQHLGSVQMAWSEFGAANAIEKEQEREFELAQVRKKWGAVLEEAFERKAKHESWLKWEHTPRVAAWHRRRGNRPPVKKIGVLT